MKLFLRFATVLVGVFALLPTSYADSIDPATFEATIDAGDSVTIDKVVTITEAPTTAILDVMFLMDVTGSMGGVIASAKAEASNILAGLGGFGDLASGTAFYSGTPPGDPAPAITSPLSTNPADTQAGIDGYTASGGGDFPEEGLMGVLLVANDTAWRPDSNRFIVMFGDASESSPGLEGDAAAALAAENITLIGIDVFGSGSFDDAYGDLADGSGGEVILGLGGDIVGTILDGITAAFSTYSEVCLDASDAPAGVSVSVSSCYMGDFTRESDEMFSFTVTITGLSEGVHTFDINALVDGGVVATERDEITVRGDSVSVPEPGTLGLLGLGLLTLAIRRRRAIR